MKNGIDFCINKIYSFFLFILCIIIAVLLHQSINIGFVGANSDYLVPIILIVMSIVYLLLLFKISRQLSKFENDSDKIAIILIVMSFILMLIIPYFIQSIPNNDLATIISEAKNLENTNTIKDIHYFSMYPNNLWILYIVTYIYRLANMISINSFLLAYIFSALSISFSFYFVYLSIKKVSNKKSALTLLVYSILNPIFYLYVTYYYNDVFTLLTISLLAYLIIDIKNEPVNKNNIYKYILIGILSYIGFKIRAVAIFPLIAFYLILLITKNMRHILITTFALILGIILGLIINFGISKSFDFTPNREETYPFTHFIMMGLNQKYNGKWNIEDYMISYNSNSYNERKKNNIEEIKKRLNDMNSREKIELIYNKYNITWAYGDSGYYNYYNVVNDINKSYDYLLGNKTLMLNYILQMNRIVLYILVLFSLICEFIKSKKDYNFIVITILGAFLFYTFWEAFPRYALSFIPIFILLIGYNFNTISKFKFQKILKLDDKKIYKYIKISVVLFTILCYLINYTYYTKDLVSMNSKAVYTNINSLNSKIYISSKDKIIQSFSTKLGFNNIKLKIENMSNLKGNIQIELYNDKYKLLYKDLKPIDKLNGISNVEFNLNKTINTHNKEYYLKISADINKNDKLALIAIHRDNTDYLRSGALIINDIKNMDDLKLDISNVSERPRLSKKVYILIAVSSLLIELYAFDLIDKTNIKKIKRKIKMNRLLNKVKI